MKVIVAGATGAVGRPLVGLLLEHGHDVVGITQSRTGAAALRAAGASAVVADALDREALLAAIGDQDADAVINELTSLRKAPARYADMESTNRLRVDGSANLVEVARRVARNDLSHSRSSSATDTLTWARVRSPRMRPSASRKAHLPIP